MTDGADLLAALQHGDSFFPSGATAFSWGLETLAGEDRVAAAKDVRVYVETQLRGRWATFDRAATIAAHRAAGDLDQVAVIDRLVEAQTLARELRQASRRIGGALLTVHRRLGTPGAEAYAARDDAPGHAAAVQGMLWHGAGVSKPAADAMAAHQLCIALLGAALRLGLIGHVDAQAILTDMRPVVAAVLATEPPVLDDIGAFVPEAEISAMRHEVQDSRLFGN
jgi:urease accessory protein